MRERERETCIVKTCSTPMPRFINFVTEARGGVIFSSLPLHCFPYLQCKYEWQSELCAVPYTAVNTGEHVRLACRFFSEVLWSGSEDLKLFKCEGSSTCKLIGSEKAELYLSYCWSGRLGLDLQCIKYVQHKPVLVKTHWVSNLSGSHTNWEVLQSHKCKQSATCRLSFVAVTWVGAELKLDVSTQPICFIIASSILDCSIKLLHCHVNFLANWTNSFVIVPKSWTQREICTDLLLKAVLHFWTVLDKIMFIFPRGHTMAAHRSLAMSSKQRTSFTILYSICMPKSW